MKTYRIITIAFCVLAFFGCTDSQNKPNQTEATSPKATSEAGLIAKPSTGKWSVDFSEANLAKGRTVYQSTCAPCHGAGGKGDGPAAVALNPKPRDHTNGAYMDKLTNAHIFFVIRNGGAPYGFPTMPAQPNLSDDEIKSVIAFVRTLSPSHKP